MQLSAKSLPSLMTAGFDRSVFDHASMTATRVEGGDHGMALSEHRQVTSKIPGVYTARIFQPGKEKEEKQEERDGRMYDALFRPGIYAGVQCLVPLLLHGALHTCRWQCICF
jgi:hypothetical protein